MKKQTALLLAGLATAGFLLFLLVQAVSFAPHGVSVHAAHRAVQEDARLDLNLATAEELQQLYGIGPKLSEAIVSWREEHGRFRAAEELLEVPGIGEKTYAGIRDYIFVEEADHSDRGALSSS